MLTSLMLVSQRMSLDELEATEAGDPGKSWVQSRLKADGNFGTTMKQRKVYQNVERTPETMRKRRLVFLDIRREWTESD